MLQLLFVIFKLYICDPPMINRCFVCTLCSIFFLSPLSAVNIFPKISSKDCHRVVLVQETRKVCKYITT